MQNAQTSNIPQEPKSRQRKHRRQVNRFAKSERETTISMQRQKKTAPHGELASKPARFHKSSSLHDRPGPKIRTLVARGWGQCPAARRVGARRRNALRVGVNGRVVRVAGFDTEDAADDGDDEAEREDYEIEHCVRGKMGPSGERYGKERKGRARGGMAGCRAGRYTTR